jgi:DNA polymerase-3 subunit gamma/tau
MTALALARKWRPKTFTELVGQDHVVKALTHALDQGRLHHAWLFTGTRGVGKTTIARIMAKALNCTGADGKGQITSQPCGQCQACTEIDGGRYVDYIEMDAASNRGVEEMVSLLEKAAYAPSCARFKVYMIDEVHMLTAHAFNSMLKTLEEPPPHVKFILATTDPQKIPVTVLSRCLQFNLKQMPVPLIVEHLQAVLQSESISSEPNALRVIAKAAQGSMRDALSLTDQAIAYAAGPVTEAAVRTMLGTIDDAYLISILDALHGKDGKTLHDISEEMGLRSMSFSIALQDLASLLHKIATAQVVPNSVLDDWPEAAEIKRLAKTLTPEETQLFYQIAITSRADLSLAPDEQAGFAMALLRMLAFKPGGGSTSGSGGSAGNNTGNTPTPTKSSGSINTASTAKSSSTKVTTPTPAPAPAPASAPSTTTANRVTAPDAGAISHQAPSAALNSAITPDWHALVRALPMRGLVQQLAYQTELVEWRDTPETLFITLTTAMSQLASADALLRLGEALKAQYGKTVKVQIGEGKATHTVAKVDAQIYQDKKLTAEEELAQDPFLKELEREFGAKVVTGSVRPLN